MVMQLSEFVVARQRCCCGGGCSSEGAVAWEVLRESAAVGEAVGREIESPRLFRRSADKQSSLNGYY